MYRRYYHFDTMSIDVPINGLMTAIRKTINIF